MANILIVVPTLVGHGMERMAFLASKVLSNSHNVKVVIFSRQNQFYYPEVETISIEQPSVDGKIAKILRVFSRSYKLKKIRKENISDYVISFGTSANIVNVLSGNVGKTVVSFRGFASIKKSVGFALTCSLADHIFCISDYMRQHLLSLCPLAKKKTTVVYNGIDIDKIEQQSKVDVGFTVSHPAFVSIGRLEDVKGHPHLLRAYKIIHDRLPQSSLILIGEGSKHRDLEKLCENLGIQDSVIFLGQKTNPFPYIKKCDIAVQASITEGFANVILEAAICGLPVIHTDCPSGPREILSKTHDFPIVSEIYESDYGLLVPPFKSAWSKEVEEEKKLADAMCLLAENSEKRAYYAVKLRERVNDFSISVYKKNLEELIK